MSLEIAYDNLRQQVEKLKQERDELAAALEVADEGRNYANELLADCQKERDELREALEMVCRIECVDDLWKAQEALAKLGADKTATYAESKANCLKTAHGGID